jgi:hypothetical protein
MTSPINLRELGLAVGAEVFVEAADDLEYLSKPESSGSA